MELSFDIKKSISKYEPIEIEDLTFYPITVDEYEEFSIARQGLEVLQQGLPLEYISMPYLQALYRLDYDANISGKEPFGFFSGCLLFLALSLRLGEKEDYISRLNRFSLIVDPSDASKLKAIQFDIGGELKRITPIQFARIKPILAQQNGIVLEGDDANPDLVQAEREIASLNAPKLEINLESMISSVCVFSGVDEKEVYSWAILKLTQRSEALKRIVDYVVCGVCEGSGCTWKGGNPVPHPFYKRISQGTSALISASDFAGGAAQKAINNVGTMVS